MQLDPPEPTLVTLERDAARVVGQNWQRALDQVFVDNLGKHRKYVVQSVRDLLRAMRNKVSSCVPPMFIHNSSVFVHFSSTAESLPR